MALNISSASAINASCFNATTNEAYDDLRAVQSKLSTKIEEVRRIFEELKPSEDKGEESLDPNMRIAAYNEARADVLDELDTWYLNSGRTIAEQPGKRPMLKIAGTHKFLKCAKALLRKTTPIGEEEDEKDKTWLLEERTTFPEEIISKDWLQGQGKGPDKGIKERLRGAKGFLEALSPRRNNEKIRTSTPEGNENRRGVGEKNEEELSLQTHRSHSLCRGGLPGPHCSEGEQRRREAAAASILCLLGHPAFTARGAGHMGPPS